MKTRQPDQVTATREHVQLDSERAGVSRARRPAQPLSAARQAADGAHRAPDAPCPGGRPCGGYMLGGGTFGGFMLGSGN
jgi:hypothetical protein